jgi:hypothetical protein
MFAVARISMKKLGDMKDDAVKVQQQLLLLLLLTLLTLLTCLHRI